MVELIPLYWATKFRELCIDLENKPIDVIAKFHVFCKQEEQALTDRWDKQFTDMQEEYEEKRDVIDFPRNK